MNTQHLEEMGCKFGEALAKLKARHMMRSLPIQGASAVVTGSSDSLSQTSTFVDEDFATYVALVLTSQVHIPVAHTLCYKTLFFCI